MKKISFVLCIATALFLIRPAYAVTLDFEGVPLTHYFFGGNQNLGNFYPGVNFGPDATILDRVTFGYNDDDYPPHSGNAVLFSDTLPNIDVIFDAPVSNVSIWYSTFCATALQFLEAYADVSMSTLLGTTTGPSNCGTSSQLTLNLSGIRAIKIHDGGDFFVIDDLTFNEVSECQCSEDGRMGCISGTVRDGEGKTVILKPLKPNRGEKHRKAVTDSNGCYIFSDLKNGRYRVWVIGQCRASHQIVKIIRGEKNDVNFECR